MHEETPSGTALASSGCMCGLRERERESERKREREAGTSMWGWGVSGGLVLTEGTPTGCSRVRECLSQEGRLRTTSGRDKWVNVVLVTMGESSASSVGWVVWQCCRVHFPHGPATHTPPPLPTAQQGLGGSHPGAFSGFQIFLTDYPVISALCLISAID